MGAFPANGFAAPEGDGWNFLLFGGDSARSLRLEDGLVAGAGNQIALGREMISVSADGKRSIRFKRDWPKVLVRNRQSRLVAWEEARSWDVGHAGKLVTGVTLAPDGGTFVISYYDDRLELRDSGTGSVRVTFNVDGLVGGSFRPVFSPDGKFLAAPCYSYAIVFLLDPVTGQRTQSFGDGSGRPMLMAAFSPDGKKLATGALDGQVRVWDIATGKSLAEFRVDPVLVSAKSAEERMITGVDFSSDGRYLLATDANFVRVWDVGELVGVPISPLPSVHTKSLASQGTDRPSEPARPSRSTGNTPAAKATPGPDNKSAPAAKATPAPAMGLANAARQNPDKKPDSALAKPVALPAGYRTRSIALAPDGKTFAMGVPIGISLWTTDDRTERAVISGDKGGTVALDFSADGKTVISLDSEGTVRLWDVAEKRERRAFKAPDARGRCVRLSPDGRTAAVASNTGVRSWDVETGVSKDLPADDKMVFGTLAFAPDGKTLAGSGRPGTIHIWDLNSGNATSKFQHGLGVVSMKFAPDGQTLATAAINQGVRLWNMADGQGRDLKSPAEPVRALDFTPDGKRLLGVSSGELRVWDASTGRNVGGARESFGAVVSLLAEPGLIVAIGSDQMLRQWRLSRLPADKPAD
jgi:WD40 repeat protein